MTNLKDTQEKAKKCNQEIQAILKKYNCGISAVPEFKVEVGGYLKVVNEVKIIPLIKLPDKENGRTRYVN